MMVNINVVKKIIYFISIVIHEKIHSQVQLKIVNYPYRYGHNIRFQGLFLASM
jgi:hypothetical protein